MMLARIVVEIRAADIAYHTMVLEYTYVRTTRVRRTYVRTYQWYTCTMVRTRYHGTRTVHACVLRAYTCTTSLYNVIYSYVTTF